VDEYVITDRTTATKYAIKIVDEELIWEVSTNDASDEPIFEPEASYEKVGQIANVVFPCGVVVIGEDIFMYYGGADQVVGVATIKMERLLRALEACKC